MQSPPMPASAPTVLLVEDDDLVSTIAADALRDAGFDVIAVSAAEDALGLAVTDVRFDALLTDIELAGPMDGWELAEALREMRPLLPVVYASGAAPAAFGARGVPGALFVPKPYRAFEICRLMEGLAGVPARPDRKPAPAAPPAPEERRAALRLIA